MEQEGKRGENSESRDEEVLQRYFLSFLLFYDSHCLPVNSKNGEKSFSGGSDTYLLVKSHLIKMKRRK